MSANPKDNGKFARRAWLRALEKTAPIDRQPDVTLPILVESWAERSESAPALVSPPFLVSYRELAMRSHQYARWGLSQDLTEGDVVVLLMANSPEYLAVWLGLTRIGVIVALVNTHLTGGALAHCIRIVAPKRIIAGTEFMASLAALGESVPAEDCWIAGPVPAAAGAEARTALAPVLGCLPGTPLSAADRALPALDATALYIYTSGTTGLPKAAKVSHYRLMQWSHWFAGMLDVQPTDRNV